MGTKINVLQVLPSLNKSAGVAQFVYSVANNIDSGYIHFDYMHHAYGDGFPLIENTYDEELIAKGAKVFTMTNAGVNFRKFFHEVKSVMSAIADNYDIVHCHMPNSAFVILREARRNGIKNRILHSHAVSSSGKKLNRVRNNILEPFGVKEATYFMACSEAAGKALFGNREFQVIENGINLERFKRDEEARKEIRSKLDINTGVVLGSVGRLEKGKNLHFLVRVFKNLINENKNAYLMILGSGSEEDDLRSYVKSFGLQDRVIFVGYADNLARYYSAMDILVFPSLAEGFGLVAVEAQACEIPCVLSSAIPKEVNVGGNNLILPITETEQYWSKRISDYLSHLPQVDRDLLEASDVNIQICVQKIIRTYEMCLGI